MTTATTLLLQWNMDFNWKNCDGSLRQHRQSLLMTLIEEHKPSLVALQEAAFDGLPVTLPSFQKHFGFAHHEKLVLAYRKDEWAPNSAIITSSRSLCIGLKHLRWPANIWLWNVHLDANLYSDDRDGIRARTRKELAPLLDRVRGQDASKTEVIAGDFNCQPYDSLVVGQDFLHANRCLTWVRTQEKRLSLPDRLLYNPCWEVLRNRSQPMGTYYYDNSMHGPWLVFDQVVFSSVHGIENDCQVKVLTSAAGQSLVSDRSGKPNRKVGSDHLPVLTLEVDPLCRTGC